MITPSGIIKGMTIARLFQEFRIGKKSGTLVASRDNETKKIYFRSGEIIYASSNQPADQLGPSLLNAGLITEQQHAAAVEAAHNTGKPLGAVLVERGFLAPNKLVEGAKHQVSKIVTSVLAWIDGKYSLDSQPIPIGEIIPLQLSAGALVLSSADSLDWKTIRKSLPSLNAIMVPGKDGPAHQQGIVLNRDQLDILALADGRRTIEEICAVSEAGDFITLKTLYALCALGILDVGSGKIAEQHAAPAADAASVDGAVSKETILRAFDALESQDYYQILDISRSAEPHEIRKAYFRFAKMYHPDRHTDSDMAELKDQLNTLFINVTEAYNILSREDSREKYTSALGRGVKRYSRGDEVPASQQNTQKTTAMTQFNEGLKQFHLNNFWGAEEAFSWAVKLDPSNAEYVFHHGLALARIPRRRHDAEVLFKQALKMAPSKIDYYMELGTFYSKNGLKAKALATFNDALRRDPNSLKVQEAIKNIGGGPVS